MKKIITIMLTMCVLTFTACANENTRVNNNSTATGDTVSDLKINVTVNGVTKTATLVDNVATKALLELLAKGDVTVKTDDYGGFEKVGELGTKLPTANSQIDTVPGDIILYIGSNICFYYGNNSWSFTRLGKLDISDVKEIREFLCAGKGKTEIVLSLKQQ